MKKAVRFLALLFAVLMLAVSCDANFTVDSYHVYDSKKLSDHHPIYMDVAY